jgi:VanZ family protein
VLQFLLLAIAIIVYGSLYPFHFESTARAASPVLAVWRGWPTEFTRFVLRDVLLNVILYVPLGVAAAMVFLRRYPRAVSAAAAIAIAFTLSAIMELLQVYEPRRDPSSLDVLTNVIGGALGALIALASEPKIRGLMKSPARGLRGAGAILLMLWALAEFYPFFPSLGRTHLYESLRGLWHTRHLPFVETWLGVAEWFAVGMALDAIFARMYTLWLAAAMLVALVAQMAIADHIVTASEVAAAAIALALWHFSPVRARLRWCLALLGSAILLRELQPFHFLPVPQPFQWTPFAATLESSRDSAVIIISRKAFDYGAMIFALRCGGWNYLGAGFAVAAALAIGETVQMYLPGRTPEITDPLLALIMMALLMRAAPRKAGARA